MTASEGHALFFDPTLTVDIPLVVVIEITTRFVSFHLAS